MPDARHSVKSGCRISRCPDQLGHPCVFTASASTQLVQRHRILVNLREKRWREEEQSQVPKHKQRQALWNPTINRWHRHKASALVTLSCAASSTISFSPLLPHTNVENNVYWLICSRGRRGREIDKKIM
ncbi:hypothetical protein GQ54DRAFT_44640 [Martensiomyces pterosporus]|nr:hypothetical protein GQ54DRAFT_44640 [Martensiomyces pterosporus]